MTASDLKQFIIENSEKDIYYKYLLGQNVWYFEKHVQDEDPLLFYDKFKKLIALKLNVHFNNVSIIGTAKTKFSFSPDKGFKEFDGQSSDFDIVIVSNELFNYFWSAFYSISKEQRIRNYNGLTSDIFRKFVSIKEDSEHYNSDSILNWQRKLTEFRTQLQLEFKIYTNINYRIYSSWESVESYHLHGIKKLKALLNEANRTN